MSRPARGIGRLLVRAAWSAYVALRAPMEGRFPFRSPRAIQRARDRRVRRTVAHAYRHVPYYQETMDELGLRPADIRTAADLAKLPLLQRRELQRDPERFRSRSQPAHRYVVRRTGGTSGEPLTIFVDRFSLFQVAAQRQRFRVILMRLAGKRFRLRQALVKGTGTEQATDRAYRRLSLAPPSIRTVDRRFSMAESPGRNVKLINEFRPDALRSFGSYLGALFQHVERSGTELHRPAAVVYGGDAMPDAVRRLISERHGIPVFSAYGAGEAFQIGFECEAHAGFHLNEDLYPLRIIDRDGREMPDGESGEVVVSNLVNRGTVVLNYRLGDVATKLLAGDRCPCGRSLPMLSLIEGRQDDWLKSPAGEEVHSQAVRTLFTQEEGLRLPGGTAFAVRLRRRGDRDRRRGPGGPARAARGQVRGAAGRGDDHRALVRRLPAPDGVRKGARRRLAADPRAGGRLSVALRPGPRGVHAHALPRFEYRHATGGVMTTSLEVRCFWRAPVGVALALLCLAGLALLASPGTASAAGPLEAGVGRADVTPETGYPLGGYVREDRTGQGQHTRLFANAMVLERASARSRSCRSTSASPPAAS